MSDYTARAAYDAAVKFYRAEQRGHVPKPPELRGLDAEAFAELKKICDFWLGHDSDYHINTKLARPISLDMLLDCLRELSRSAERHTALQGRQGYLSFIADYLP